MMIVQSQRRKVFNVTAHVGLDLMECRSVPHTKINEQVTVPQQIEKARGKVAECENIIQLLQSV